jgi:hypothetical protein
MPGRYTVRLTVEGKALTEPLMLKMDPRVKSTTAELAQQFAMQKSAADAMNESFEALEELGTVRQQVLEREDKAGGELKAKLIDFNKQVADLAGATLPGFFGTPQTGKQPETFASLNQRFGRILAITDSADAAPTATIETVARELRTALKEEAARWRKLKNAELPSLNQLLEKEKLAKIDPEKSSGEAPSAESEGDDEP